jgi:GT2 family glycosyltransferase
MIIVYHKKNQVDSVFDCNTQLAIENSNKGVVNELMHLATTYEEQIIVWCHSDQKQRLNKKAIERTMYLKNIIVSYNTINFLPPQIGYVEDSPFIKVNRKVTYPTWQMSGLAGAIYGFQLLKFKDLIRNNDIDYALNSIAKLGMQNGLFSYAVPDLLLESSTEIKKTNTETLFRFVKQHFKTRWVFLLALNYLWHEKKLVLWPLLSSLFYKKKKFSDSITLESINPKEDIPLPSIDVIIPTIGREKYVYDVLKDLAVQTHLPRQVIIVEQNPDKKSSTNLGFINNESWPFKIVHHFIHQIGACNSRNLGLKEVTSKYVFLADDDISFESNLLTQSLKKMHQNKLSVITLSCLQKNELEQKQQPLQWPTFGAGCSILKSSYLEMVSFNKALEFGYGEDVDFGMQLRNSGADIIYMPEFKILHLKAPVGGFRSNFKLAWINDKIQPKPSPTIMLNKMNNSTEHQLMGYKTLLVINYYFRQKIRNPFSYYKLFHKQWQRSVFWAKQINETHS